MQLPAPARQHLVRIGLMSDIPNQAVIRSVEHIMQGNCQLDSAQPGRKMAAPSSYAVDQELTQFTRQFDQFGRRQTAQIRRRVDGFEQWASRWIGCHLPQFILRNPFSANALALMLRICTTAVSLT